MIMARLSNFNLVHFAKCLRSSIPSRHISFTRRLMSQEWQQEGVPGSNLPFSFKNKYLFTLKMLVFVASGLNAPFLIALLTLKRMNTPVEVVPEQELTTVYCKES